LPTRAAYLCGQAETIVQDDI